MFRTLFIVILFSIASDICADSVDSRQWTEGCDPNSIVSYRATVQTYWTEQLFPKSYPKWRPPPQWSKTYGITHNDNYTIYTIGDIASENLGKFAEKGEVADLAEIKDSDDVFDRFTIPAIKKGAGESRRDFFAHGNHSKISLVCKMIPSPDWFVGLSGFDLCDNGEWIDVANVTMDLLDVGTQGGFTFTSPGWKLTEPEEITRITSRSPSHRASSFYYPELETLPVIARVVIKKIQEHPYITTITSLTDDVYNETLETTTEAGIYETINPLTLDEESMNVLSNITDIVDTADDSFYPKHFRPKIIRKKVKNGRRTSGDLLRSRLPTNINIPKTTSFNIGW